jgi:glycosyltransferase involved in cell wall biosynthesis
MKQITLAIPTYNTSRYFLDCIKYAIDDDFIQEIVVNDDFSCESDYSTLSDIIASLNSDKIKLYRNSENLGAFKNKYVTVSKANSDWIYLLDSDNHPFEDTYDIIKTLDWTNVNICYSPKYLFCMRDGGADARTVEYSFPYDLIGIEESKDGFLKGWEWFSWFVNTGNYFFNKSFYLESLNEGISNFTEFRLEADTIGAFYFMIKNNGKIKIVDGLKHNHRLRPDSYWHTCGENSNLSVEFFINAIKNLPDSK